MALKMDEKKEIYYNGEKLDSEEDNILPIYSLRKNEMKPKKAYTLIKEKLSKDNNSKLNLGTFCQTYMENEAELLIYDNLDKNASNKNEYVEITEIENRCIKILSNLWNVPKKKNYIGASVIGSSEGCMLGGLSMKFNWMDRAQKLGLNISKRKPNLIISAMYQVCWEKFCIYWDVEMRVIPIDDNCTSLNVDRAIECIDEYTIGVVGILGTTYTGEYDDIKKLNDSIEEYNKNTELKVYIHIDAALGGLITPFIDSNIEWDFRLNNVVSISTSGHKYGLVYPGVGWVIWKDKHYINKKLIFDIYYLQGKTPTISINFSKSASQIIGQYYNFVRYGFEGYNKIHSKTRTIAIYIYQEMDRMDIFKFYNCGREIPIIVYKLKDNSNIKWNLYDLKESLFMYGWQIPTYKLPQNLNNVVVQRIVCRAEFDYIMAKRLLSNIKESIKKLNMDL